MLKFQASCNAEGTIAHYECSKCHKYFDKNKNEVDSLTIEKSNSHNFVNGECTVCGEKRSEKTLSADFTTKESKIVTIVTIGIMVALLSKEPQITKVVGRL